MRRPGLPRGFAARNDDGTRISRKFATAFTGPIEDRIAIHELHGASADCSSRGDTARGRCTAREIICPKDGKVFKLIGLYRDPFVREDGAWKFALRNNESLVFEDPT